METNSTPFLSVIIPCYNAEATIGEQLEALCRQQWSEPWEIVIADNRCTDGSRDVIARYRARLPRLRIIDAHERQGAAYALNAGIRAARADALAFCDADDVVCDGWVAAMGEGLARYDFVSGPFETQRLNHSTLTRNRHNAQEDGIQHHHYPPFLPHAGSGNMGMRRDVYKRVGAFDESLEALYDTDFCWKAQLQGISITPLAGAVLHLRHRNGVRPLLRQARQYAECDVRLYKRYRPFGMPKLPVRKGIRAWVDLLRFATKALNAETRPGYLWDIGWRTGRLTASVRHRVWAL